MSNAHDIAAAIDSAYTMGRKFRNEVRRAHDAAVAMGLPAGHWIWAKIDDAAEEMMARAGA